MVRIIRRKGLSARIADVAGRIKRDFLRWDRFDKSVLTACQSQDSVVELMPIAAANESAFKCVNAHPKGIRVGLPMVMDFGLRVDFIDSADLSADASRRVSELTIVTAICTSATSATAVRGLARPDSR